MPRMTRSQMEDVLRSGRSLLHNGRLITRLEDLPGEESLLEADDHEARGKLLGSLASQIKELQARHDAVQGQVQANAPAATDAAKSTTVKKPRNRAGRANDKAAEPDQTEDDGEKSTPAEESAEEPGLDLESSS